MTLLGKERQDLVRSMASAFDSVSRGGDSQWWSLEAPPGWGKTRLLQALFEELSSGQHEPAYWPPTLHDEEDASDLGSSRKRLYPDPRACSPHATPQYFWWGIACMSRPGSNFEALAQDLGQFTAHQSGLEKRWRELASSRDKVMLGLGRRRSEVYETVAGEGLSMAAGAANLAVPGLGLMVMLAKWGLQTTASSFADDDPAPARELSFSELVDDVAPELERLGRGGIATVIAIEDFHAADPVLTALLKRLLTTTTSRVLVVTTSWPGLLEDRDRHAAGLMRDVACRRIRADVELSDLSQQELAQLAQSAIPGMSEQFAHHLASHFDNPLAVQAACQLGRVRRAAARETVDPALLVGVARDVMGVHRELWSELPATVREALTLAAMAAPADINPTFGFDDERWNPQILASALATTPELLEADGDLLEDLTRAREPYMWVRDVAAALQQFDEPSFREVARQHALAEYGDSDRADLHAALGRALVDHAVDLSSEAREHSERMVLSLVATGSIPSQDPLAGRIALAVGRRLAQSSSMRDLATLVAVTEMLDAEGRDVAEGAELRVLAAVALRGLGRAAEAAERLSALVPLIEHHEGPRASATLDTKFHLAVALEKAGHPSQAVTILEEVVANLHQPGRLATQSLLAAQAALGTALGGSGRLHDAVKVYTDYAQRVLWLMGADSAVTLRARSNRAWWLGEMGELDSAISELREALDTAEQALGESSPETATIRSNLANWLGESGDHEGAVRLLEQVIVDRTRQLGKEAPDTFRARSNRAWWLMELGRLDDAKVELDSLRQDRERILGPSAPDTLRTRRYLAVWRERSGDREGALLEMRALRRDRLGALGGEAFEARAIDDELARMERGHANLSQDMVDRDATIEGSPG